MFHVLASSLEKPRLGVRTAASPSCALSDVSSAPCGRVFVGLVRACSGSGELRCVRFDDAYLFDVD